MGFSHNNISSWLHIESENFFESGRIRMLCYSGRKFPRLFIKKKQELVKAVPVPRSSVPDKLKRSSAQGLFVKAKA